MSSSAFRLQFEKAWSPFIGPFEDTQCDQGWGISHQTLLGMFPCESFSGQCYSQFTNKKDQDWDPEPYQNPLRDRGEWASLLQGLRWVCLLAGRDYNWVSGLIQNLLWVWCQQSQPNGTIRRDSQQFHLQTGLLTYHSWEGLELTFEFLSRTVIGWRIASRPWCLRQPSHLSSFLHRWKSSRAERDWSWDGVL